jgi:hypothetical protein
MWEREVDRVKHLYFVGNETSPDQTFFMRYLYTGQIGCPDVLYTYATAKRIPLDANQPVLEQLSMLAKRFYGRLVAKEEVIQDVGQAMSLNDLRMFGQYKLPEGAKIQEIDERDLLGSLMPGAGTMPGATALPITPSLPFGAFGVSNDPMAALQAMQQRAVQNATVG